MTPGGTWPFPPGRALHGWFSELSSRQPQQLWFSHLVLHRVEALAAVKLTHRLDALQLALLRLLSTDEVRDAPNRLHVDRQLLVQWLHALAGEGLAHTRDDRWELTDAGRNAIATGAYTQPGRERRAFFFVDQRDLHRPAHFLHLLRPGKPYPTPGLDYYFDPRWLVNCLQRPPQWKHANRFPDDVEAVLGGMPPNDATAALSWREVLLDRCEHLAVAVIRSGNAVYGFSVQTEDWKLSGPEPVFELTDDWQAVLPDLTGEPPPESWRAAWNGWCRQRSLPTAETDACQLERRDYQLEVRAPRRLIDRLKTTRSDVLHGETWLLAGTGRTRWAACVKVVEGEG